MPKFYWFPRNSQAFSIHSRRCNITFWKNPLKTHWKIFPNSNNSNPTTFARIWYQGDRLQKKKAFRVAFIGDSIRFHYRLIQEITPAVNAPLSIAFGRHTIYQIVAPIGTKETLFRWPLFPPYPQTKRLLFHLLI